MYNVLGGPVKKIITDHKRIIIAHTAKVFPTWIWAPEDATEAELDQIFQRILAEFAPIREYRFNTRYSIAGYLLQRLRESGQGGWKITTNIVAYECHQAKKPGKKVSGRLERLSVSQEELAAKMIEEASVAIGDRVMNREESQQAAKEQLERQIPMLYADADYAPSNRCYQKIGFEAKGRIATIGAVSDNEIM